MKIDKNYFHNIMYYFIAIFFSQGSTFFSGIILARMLDIDTYGKFTYLLIFVNTFIAITGLGLTSAANRFVSELKNEGSDRLAAVFSFFSKSLLAVNLPVLLSLLLLSQFVNNFFFSFPVPIDFWILLIIIILSSSFINLFIGTLQGFLKYKELALSSLIYGVTYVLGIYIFTLIFSLKGIFIGILFSSVLFYMILYFFIKKRLGSFSFTTNLRKTDRTLILNYIIPNMLISFLTMPTFLITQKYLSITKDGFNAIALFNVAYAIVNLAAIIPSLINTVISSYLFSHTKNTSIFNTIFRNNQIGLYSIVLMEVILLLLLGKIVLTIYGNNYQEAYPILVILSLSLFFDIISNTYSNVIVARNKMWKSFLQIALPRDIVTLILGYFLTISYGAIGLALTLLFTKMLSSIFTYLTSKQITAKGSSNFNLI